MAGTKSLVLLHLLALAVAISIAALSLAGRDHLQLNGAGPGRGKECRGTMGECHTDADSDDDDVEGEPGFTSAISHGRLVTPVLFVGRVR
jgi:hypothetical protein